MSGDAGLAIWALVVAPADSVSKGIPMVLACFILDGSSSSEQRREEG
jgi:hypothetical protein